MSTSSVGNIGGAGSIGNAGKNERSLLDRLKAENKITEIATLISNILQVQNKQAMTAINNMK
jgi:hypothetical protein